MRLAGIAVFSLCVALSGCSSSTSSSGSNGNTGASTVATPVFSLPAGMYNIPETVTITDSTAGATIYYTTNGTTPTTSSTLYSAPITISASETITAIAVESGYINSAVASAAYVISTGIITTVAGNGTVGYSGDGGAATNAELSLPISIAVDNSGNLYIADEHNQRVREVTPNGIISTYAGNGTFGYRGDGGAANSAELNNPSGVTLDNSGDLYISDQFNERIRKITTVGTISTVAGNGTLGYSGDGGVATNSELGSPYGSAVDSSGNLYIADYNNNRIRKVTAAGIISTVAGNGTQGYSGDGGPATSAQFNLPTCVAVDSVGNLYIADVANNRIRKVTLATGVITTVAGNGTRGFSGDSGTATSAELYEPPGIALDTSGNLYIADAGNNRIRKVTPAGIISTIAGNGMQGYGGDGGPATSAELSAPYGVALDSSGNLYIADSFNNRVRKITY